MYALPTSESIPQHDEKQADTICLQFILDPNVQNKIIFINKSKGKKQPDYVQLSHPAPHKLLIVEHNQCHGC